MPNLQVGLVVWLVLMRHVEIETEDEQSLGN